MWWGSKRYEPVYFICHMHTGSVLTQQYVHIFCISDLLKTNHWILACRIRKSERCGNEGKYFPNLSQVPLPYKGSSTFKRKRSQRKLSVDWLESLTVQYLYNKLPIIATWKLDRVLWSIPAKYPFLLISQATGVRNIIFYSSITVKTSIKEPMLSRFRLMLLYYYWVVIV